jgi:acetylornithine deacetylase
MDAMAHSIPGLTAPPTSVETLLAAMVRIPSVNTASSGDMRAEQPLCEMLDVLARSWGLVTQRLPVPHRGDQLLITLPAPASEADWILLDAHLDTVAVAGMTIDPFAAAIDQDILQGRGACDTKACAAAMLWMMRDLVAACSSSAPLASAAPDASPALVHCNAALLLSIDEESTMAGIRRFIAHDLPQLPWRQRIRGVVVGEPTLLKPVVAHQGDVRFELSTRGRTAHSSTPWQGRSAISDMLRLLTAVESRYIPSVDAYDALTGKAACSVNVIRGGSAVNVIPDACTVLIDRRLAPRETVAPVTADFTQFLAREASHVTGLNYELNTTFQAPPLASHSSQGRWLGQVQHALRSLNLDPAPVGVPYATHAGDLSQAKLPTLVLGPGDIAQAHQPDEFIRLDQLRQAVAVYRALLVTP